MTPAPALAADLMTKAICNTDHPAEAVGALFQAAALALHPTFGTAGAIAIMRQSIDDLEASLPPGEADAPPPPAH